jgi:hypothetical protein
VGIGSLVGVVLGRRCTVFVAMAGGVGHTHRRLGQLDVGSSAVVAFMGG